MVVVVVRDWKKPSKFADSAGVSMILDEALIGNKLLQLAKYGDVFKVKQYTMCVSSSQTTFLFDKEREMLKGNKAFRLFRVTVDTLLFIEGNYVKL